MMDMPRSGAQFETRPKRDPMRGQARLMATGTSGNHAGTTVIDPLAAFLPRKCPDSWLVWGIGALAFLVFANSLWNGFAFDDGFVIEDNPVVHDLSALWSILASGYWRDSNIGLLYRPLVILSYAFNYALAGAAPFTYHLVNVLLHAGNSALVYLLVVALFRARGLAMGAAAAFALHPIHTEAVANVVGRAELLANAFLLLSWLWYLRWGEAPARARSRGLAASVAAFGLALLTKEHAVVLLGLLVVTDLLRASQEGLPLGRTIWERCRSAYAWYLLPLAAYLLTRLFVLGVLLGSQPSWWTNPLAHVDFWTRWATAIKVLGKYLWLLVVPVHLSADYSYNRIPLSRSLLEPGALTALLALAGALGLAVRGWRRWPAISVGIAVLAVTILPVSNLPFPIGTIMAERLLYLPSMGFCLLLATLVTALAARPRWGAVASGAFAVLLLAYGARTVVRNRDWRSEAALFAATVRTSPNSTAAHYNLGTAMLNRGDLPGARRAFERSLEIYPDHVLAHTNLGIVLQREGRLDDALAAFREALRILPEFAFAHLNLGRLYEQRGEASEALREYRLAAVHAPSFPSLALHVGLGSAFFAHGDLAEAERWARLVFQARPYSAEAHFNLGTVYRKQGKLPEAIAAFREAVRLKPSYRRAYYAMGVALQQQGRMEEAQRAFEAARYGIQQPLSSEEQS